MYRITEDTFVVINGDGSPWIRSGVDYFQNAIYVYDHYHTKKWIKSALSNRTKQERRKAYLAADERDPVALLVAVAEAENAEIDEEKKEEIKELRLFILNCPLSSRQVNKQKISVEIYLLESFYFEIIYERPSRSRNLLRVPRARPQLL